MSVSKKTIRYRRRTLVEMDPALWIRRTGVPETHAPYVETPVALPDPGTPADMIETYSTSWQEWLTGERPGVEWSSSVLATVAPPPVPSWETLRVDNAQRMVATSPWQIYDSAAVYVSGNGLGFIERFFVHYASVTERELFAASAGYSTLMGTRMNMLNRRLHNEGEPHPSVFVETSLRGAGLHSADIEVSHRVVGSRIVAGLILFQPTSRLQPGVVPQLERPICFLQFSPMPRLTEDSPTMWISCGQQGLISLA